MFDEDGSSAPSSTSVPAAAVVAQLTGAAESMSVLIRVAKGLINIHVFPVEMLIRPRFGSEYFHPLIVLASMIALHGWVGIAWLLQILSYLIPEPYRPHDAPVGMGVLYLMFIGAVIYHAVRIKRLMQNLDLELDSEEDGVGYRIFAFLPKADNWMRVRVWYEPSLALSVTLTLYVLHVLNIYAAIYLSLSAVMLFGKTLMLSYESWRFYRQARNKRNRAVILREIFNGRRSPQTFGGRVLASVPISDPEVRAYAAAEMTGLNAEYAHLVSNPEPVPDAVTSAPPNEETAATCADDAQVSTDGAEVDERG